METSSCRSSSASAKARACRRSENTWQKSMLRGRDKSSPLAIIRRITSPFVSLGMLAEASMMSCWLQRLAAEDNLEAGGLAGAEGDFVVADVAGFHANHLVIFFIAEIGHGFGLGAPRVPDHAGGGAGFFHQDFAAEF